MKVPVILFDQQKAYVVLHSIKAVDRRLKTASDEERIGLRVRRLRLSQMFLSAFKVEGAQ